MLQKFFGLRGVFFGGVRARLISLFSHMEQELCLGSWLPGTAQSPAQE